MPVLRRVEAEARAARKAVRGVANDVEATRAEAWQCLERS